MAVRARLIPTPPAPKEEWPHHTSTWKSLPSHLFWRGDRRMEAESFLKSGYVTRLGIEARAAGWMRLGQVANVWQPNRLKGIQVGESVGTPFFAATQLFSFRPRPRKWLAVEKTPNSLDRFVTTGTILVTCSGSVGRTTMATSELESSLVTHDLLRVVPSDPALAGWIYAFLHSRQGREMMTSAHYGQIIKHLEVAHLNALPIPIVKPSVASEFSLLAQRIQSLRTTANEQATDADSLYGECVGLQGIPESEEGFSRSVAELMQGRRRLEASYYEPTARHILTHIKQTGIKVQTLKSASTRVWWMTRFRRFYGEEGVPYFSADELFSVNPEVKKRILVKPGDGHEDFFVNAGWIAIACSGQTYGLNGSARLLTKHHENTFFSHDLIRVIPNESKIRTGYLATTLSHRGLGRPLLLRNAYGTSIPHLDPADVELFPVIRLEKTQEARIADLAESAAEQFSEADALEQELGRKASDLIEEFSSGNGASFVLLKK